MLWVLRLQSHETRVFYISQEHWEEQGTRCYYKKLYKLFEKHEKLYRLTIKKLSDILNLAFNLGETILEP